MISHQLHKLKAVSWVFGTLRGLRCLDKLPIKLKLLTNLLSVQASRFPHEKIENTLRFPTDREQVVASEG